MQSHHPLRGRQAALLSPRNFENTIDACLVYWMIPSAAWRYWRLNDPLIATLQRPVQWRLSMLLNGSDNPRKLPLPLGASEPPSKIWFHGPTRVFTQNGMSAVFLHSALQSVPYYFTMGRYVFPPNIAPFPWGIGSPSNTPRAHPSCQPKWHLDRFSRFCMGPKCYVV